MIVLRTPKGWTCPPVVDGQQVEGTFRAHQVPLPGARTNDEHRARARGVDAVLPARGAVRRRRPAGARSCARSSPTGDRRMSANPVANGGALLRRPAAARLARLRASTVDGPGATAHEATRVLGGWLRDVTRLNPDNFLTFAPDELASNRLQDILEVTGRATGRPAIERARRAPRPRRPGLRDALASTSARACSRATC